MKKNYIKTFESFDGSNDEELIRSVLYKYEDMYNTNPFDSLLFRGTDYYTQTSFKIIKPKLNRKSISFLNEPFDAIHNLWMSENPNWKDYPSRRRECTIASTDYDYASQFGHSTYVVFPLNIQNSNIAVCPASDLIHSFSKSIQTLKPFVTNDIENFSLIFYRLFPENSNETTSLIEGEYTYEKLLKNIETLNKIILDKNKIDFLIDKLKYNTQKETAISIVNWCKENNKSLYDFFEHLINPTINNFKLIKNISELDNIPRVHNGHEVWFTGPAIFMEVDSREYPKMDNILEKIHRYINS